MSANMYMASLAWLLLVLGYLNRKKRQVHVPLMLTGIVMDMALVCYLQITRGAIGTALQFRLSFWQQTHIGVSSAALLLYLPVLYLGWRLFTGNPSPGLRQLHIRIATSALLLRTLGFFLMFSMLR